MCQIDILLTHIRVPVRDVIGLCIVR